MISINNTAKIMKASDMSQKKSLTDLQKAFGMIREQSYYDWDDEGLELFWDDEGTAWYIQKHENAYWITLDGEPFLKLKGEYNDIIALHYRAKERDTQRQQWAEETAQAEEKRNTPARFRNSVLAIYD